MKSARFVIVILLYTLAFIWPLYAASIKIKSDQQSGTLTILAENADLNAVLHQLAKIYKFKVEGKSKNYASREVPNKITGRLEEILSRLLRNENYLIVRKNESTSGISKLVILGQSRGTDTQTKSSQRQKNVRSRNKTNSPQNRTAQQAQKTGKRAPGK